jgi:hypothetical protein
VKSSSSKIPLITEPSVSVGTPPAFGAIDFQYKE